MKLETNYLMDDQETGLYVDPKTGSDENAGTWGSPLKTIEAAYKPRHGIIVIRPVLASLFISSFFYSPKEFLWK